MPEPAERIYPQKKARAAVYTGKAGVLFVPTLRLWQASMMAKRMRAKRSDGKQLSLSKLARAARVNKTVLRMYLRRYAHYEWFRPWLLAGERPTSPVTIATPQQVRAASKAFDWWGHCLRADLDPGKTYPVWINTGLIPDADWLKWLYGGPIPAGAFLVTPAMERLRSAFAKGTICKAAGISTATPNRWQNDPEKGKALDEAVRIQRRELGRSRAEFYPRMSAFRRLQMLNYARAASVAECVRRAGMPYNQYKGYVAKSKKLGVQELFFDYLQPKGQLTVGGVVRIGLVADNFFIPSASMRAFRRVASREMAEQRIRSLRCLPGFDEWFLDWTIPRPTRGRRVTLPRSARPSMPTAAPVQSTESRSAELRDRVEKDFGEKDPAFFIEAEARAAGHAQRPSKEREPNPKHVKWYKWHVIEGLSYAQTAQRQFDQTGETVTREAVIQAIKRLPDAAKDSVANTETASPKC